MDISYSRTTCNCLQILAQCTYKIRMTAVYTKVLFSKTTAKIPMGIAQMNFEMNLYTYSLFLTFLIFFHYLLITNLPLKSMISSVVFALHIDCVYYFLWCRNQDKFYKSNLSLTYSIEQHPCISIFIKMQFFFHFQKRYGSFK